MFQLPPPILDPLLIPDLDGTAYDPHNITTVSPQESPDSKNIILPEQSHRGRRGETMILITLTLLLAAWLIRAGHHDFKQIPDLEALGYTVQGSTPISGEFVRYDVLYNAIFLADLAIYKDNKWPGALVVFNVQTDDDTRPEALSLRDIQLGVWVYTIHRDAAKVFEVKYMDVYEPKLVAVTHRVYELMGVPESQSLV